VRVLWVLAATPVARKVGLIGFDRGICGGALENVSLSDTYSVFAC
jgi:hypothetical protein